MAFNVHKDGVEAASGADEQIEAVGGGGGYRARQCVFHIPHTTFSWAKERRAVRI